MITPLQLNCKPTHFCRIQFSDIAMIFNEVFIIIFIVYFYVLTAQMYNIRSRKYYLFLSNLFISENARMPTTSSLYKIPVKSNYELK